MVMTRLFFCPICGKPNLVWDGADDSMSCNVCGFYVTGMPLEEVEKNCTPIHSIAQERVACPVCGKSNFVMATFRCKVCGRDYLCQRHYDTAERCCCDCAAKERKVREEEERTSSGLASSPLAQLFESPEPPKPPELETGTLKTLTLPGGARMEMIYCAPGEFMMGSPTNEPKRNLNETQHRVRITKGFWLGKYPVTQHQWHSVMGDNPSHWTYCDECPVDSVSWEDCQGFIKRLNASLNCGARLPTEAEWEYACRAGTKTPYSWGSSLNGGGANCDGNYPYGTTTKGPSQEKTTPVGRYWANPWGFYDMHGNVDEWCSDWPGDYPSGGVTDPAGSASGVLRVLRGGHWNSSAQCCRSAFRFSGDPGYRGNGVGFRLCCSAGPLG